MWTVGSEAGSDVPARSAGVRRGAGSFCSFVHIDTKRQRASHIRMILCRIVVFKYTSSILSVFEFSKIASNCNGRTQVNFWGK